MRIHSLASRAARVLTAAAAVAGFTMHFATAEQMVFASQTLNIEPPAGYCALERSREAEASILTAQENAQSGSNRVALFFVDCADLKKARESGTYDLVNFGTLLVPMQHGDVVAYTGTREEFVAEVAKQSGDFDADKVIEAVKERLKQSGVSASGVQMLGVLAKDDAALYFGVTLDGAADAAGGAPRHVLGIVALTLVNDIAVSINLYRAGADDNAVTTMLAQDKASVAALIAANADLEAQSARWKFLGIDLAGVGGAALTGAAIGALVGLVLFLVKRLRRRGTS